MDATRIKVYLISSNVSNRHHLIPLASTHAMQHLAVLLERYAHGKELYGDQDPQWEKDLRDTYTEYKQYFIDVLPEWANWRKSKMTIEMGVEHDGPFFLCAYGNFQDQIITSEKYSYRSGDGINDPNFWANAMGHIQERVLNTAQDQLMLTAIAPTFFLVRFLPDQANADPVPHSENLGKIVLGPYHSDPWYNDPDNYLDDPTDKIIDHIIVNEWNSIDWLQIFYTDGSSGNGVGDDGGQEHNIGVKRDNKWVTAVNTQSDQGILAAIQFVFSDGTQTNMLGNRSGWQTRNYSTGPQGDYYLTGFSLEQGPGPSDTQGTHRIKLHFTYKTLILSHTATK